MQTMAIPSQRQRLSLLAVGALAGVLAAVVAAPSVVPARGAETSDTKEHTISVAGTGSVFVKPDVADLSIGVSVQRDRAGDAAIDAAAEMDKVIKALLAQGIAEDDIQTTQLSLDAVWDYDRSPARVVGYQATNIVSVTIRDLTKVGAIVDAATDAGANTVSSLAFRVEDPTAFESQAREAAMAAARAKADQLAASADVTITGVISIVENSSPAPMPIYYGEMDAAMAADERAATPVLTGTEKLTVDVAVVYSIE